MKTQTKIFLLIFLIVGAFIIGLVFLRYSEINKTNLILRDKEGTADEFFTKILALKTSSIEAFARNFTYWDDMVSFVATADKEWGDENIAVSHYDFDTTAAWVYSLDPSLVYSTNILEDDSLKELPLPKDAYKKLFAVGPFCHFFLNTPKGLVEIAGATIHPTEDSERKTPPRGYFFVGRLWDQSYIDKLGKLTESTITIIPVEEAKTPEKGSPRLNDSITVSKTLTGWDESPVAEIVARSKSPMIKELARSSSQQFALFVLFALALMFLVFISLTRWVSSPLGLVSKSLSSEDSAIVKSLQNDKTEFGQLARLICKFFEQKADLIKEIAEHKNAEEMIGRLRHQNELILNSAGEGIYGVDSEGKLTFVNPATARMLGWEVEELVGKYGHDTLHHSKPDGTPYPSKECPIYLAYKDGTVHHVDNEVFWRRDGTSFPVEYVSTPVREGDKMVGAVVVCKDITERKQAQEALRRAHDELEIRVQERTVELVKANEVLQAEIAERERAENLVRLSLREKEVLLKEIHHRVKNNLQVISSLLNLQSGCIKDKEALEMFKESQNRVKSMALIHEKLYQSEGLVAINFAEYTQNLVNYLSRSYGASSESVTLKINVNGVSLDIDKAIPCGLIINELVSNSLKHAFPEGKEGEICIDLDSDEGNGESRGHLYTLIISDNGIGFPNELDFRNTESLGLRIVNSLTGQLGGSIELDRSGGTRFKITFEELKYKSIKEGVKAMANVKVLVVEDESITAMDIQNRLESLGYDVSGIASSGEDAVRKTEETKPDLVLMDIMLKGHIDGVEAAEQIRGRFDIPVIYLTAYSDNNTLQRAKITEPYGYLLKPFEERELQTAIDIAIYKHNMERKLKERERWLATTLKSIGDAVIATDAEGLVTFMNPVAEGLMGWKKEDAFGKDLGEVFNIMNEETRTVVESPVKKALQEGIVVGLANHTILIAKDGRETPIDDSAAPIRDDKGNITGVVLVFRDVTDRKQAKEALHNSEERYRALYDNNPSMYFTVDTEGKVLSVNQFGAKQLGYTAEDLIGQSILMVFREDDKKAVLDQLSMCLRSPGEVFQEELCKVRRDGSTLWVREIARSVRGSDGNTFILIVCENTTEGRQMEKALKESERKYRALVENSYDFTIETDIEGRFLYLSPNHKEGLGYEPAELIDRSIFEHIHPEDRLAVMAEFRRALITHSSGRISFRFRHKNGEWRWVESSGKVFQTAAGELRAVITSRDMTEHKKIEEELRRIHKLESLGILAGGIAHDFNNLLTGILGNISLAKMYANPEDKVYKRLTEAEKASIRAKDLTGQLLTFSKGGAPVKKLVQSLGNLIKETTNFGLSGSNVRCVFSTPEDLWAVEIDEGQISQAIGNLVINSAQAMPEGGMINISAKNVNVRSEDGLPLKEGRYVSIKVEDEGIGIRKEHLSKIFDPYFTTKGNGSGLGLAIVHSIVRNHNGYIGVDSELGVGTKFFLYIPASDEEIVIKKRSVRENPTIGRGKVLVMDDEEIVRETLGEMLHQIGYEAELARDGGEAIGLYTKAKESNKPFDLIILDLTVQGGIGGKDTIKRLLEIDPAIKAIVSSGYSSDQVMSNYKEYGFKGVVTKPYKVEELSKTVYEVINEK